MSDVEPYLRRRAELFLQHCPGASFTIDHNEGPHDLDSLCAGLVDAAGLTARPSSVGAGSCPEDGMRLVEIALDAGPAHDDEVAPGTQAEAPGPGSSPRRLFLFVAERSSTDGALVGAFVDYLQGSERFDLASRAD